jgi:hypothetical protein
MKYAEPMMKSQGFDSLSRLAAIDSFLADLS